MEFTLPQQEQKRISLASINILQPKCECKKCTCKSHLHKKAPAKSLPKPKPFVQPKSPTKPKSIKPPKKVRKRIKKHHSHRVNSHKVQRIKKTLPASKPTKSPPKPAKPAAPAPAKPIPTRAQPLASKSVEKASPSSKSIFTPKVSYQELYSQKYLASIREAIARHKFYPRLARRTRKEGVVLVEFVLTPKGLGTLKVARTSGHTILDRAAVRTIRSASGEFPLPKVPIRLKVPLEYRLR